MKTILAVLLMLLSAPAWAQVVMSGTFVMNGSVSGSGGGGGGTPGGSNTQLQYNNAGNFGGITGATTNGTAVTLTSPLFVTAASPSSNDGAALGTTALQWSDLFMASGGVLNFANGNWVATHTSGILTVGTGDLRVTTAGTNAASVVTVGGTQTLTAKRVTPRVDSLTDAATVTPATDAYDGGVLATLSQATLIDNPTGTPTDFQRYTLRIKSTTTRALTYGSQFRGSADLALPSSTSGSSLTDYFIFQWNGADSKWDFVGRNFGF